MNNDGRKLSREALADIRIKAAQRVEEGESPEEVIELLGFHRSNIYHWIAQYREGGFEALRKKSGLVKNLSSMVSRCKSSTNLLPQRTLYN